jgi:hypothetical protein
MFTGRDALLSVEHAISRVRADEGRLDAALRSAIEDAARLRREEAEGFRALARVRLDALMRDQVIGALDATEQRALAMIENHRRELEGLARRRDEAQAALDKVEAVKHDRDQDLASALDALDQQRHRTADRVRTDPAWSASKAALEAAENIATNADQKASFAEADLGAKRKPYEDDPLFMYLWRKRHGQSTDTSGRLVRFFDRKVARLVGYRDARANYAMLQEIPIRLREHAKNKQDEVEAAKERVAEMERQALVADGIEPLEARVAAGHAAVKAAADAVVKVTAELRQIEAERAKVVGAGDEAAYGQAVELLAQALAREDLRELYQEAVATATRTDDQAISSISAARAALAKTDGEVTQIRAEIREMARRRTELEGARDRARSGGYDDPRGTFGSGPEIIGEVIAGILRGVLRGRDLDRVFRNSYRYPAPRTDYDFGGGRGEPSWPSPWTVGGEDTGSSWDPGGSDDTEDSGGSGWRTGGHF